MSFGREPADPIHVASIQLEYKRLKKKVTISIRHESDEGDIPKKGVVHNQHMVCHGSFL